ncbi:hypothetical protein E4U09_003740 [Claviceps aff. purpurea]|uniref:PIPK domain-containing protein n=1 Tax=Claviceps aff. purpurea TaxID=1967640 RepID=A0A9P7QRI3_9HYPO|nr:hypothetical protein E4U09_003740 [Claviceps aff. purpurea]
MGARNRRSDAVANAISRALDNQNDRQVKTWGKSMRDFFGLFSPFHLDLTRRQYADFHVLRHDFWDIEEDQYTSSFQPSASRAAEGPRPCDRSQEYVPSLESAADLGYSDSSLLHTSDGKYLVKSLNRSRESDSVVNELFDSYTVHVKTHPSSLLARVTDVLYAPRATLGSILGIQSRHHIIMENLLQGLGNNRDGATDDVKWETYDLKPDDSSSPEHDLTDGASLRSDEAVQGFVGEILDQVDAPPLVRQELIDILLEDTKFLARSNIANYSLLFARFPKAEVRPAATIEGEEDQIASTVQVSPSWRSGVSSTDGKWIYRAALLDFLWSTHKTCAKERTGFVGAFSSLFKKGRDSIPTEPEEYRSEFMGVVRRQLSRRDDGAGAGNSAEGSQRGALN